MKLAKLHNQIQNFSWGSESYLPELLGYPNPEQEPQAELWMGVHPLGESYVEGVVEGSSERIPLSEYLLDGNGKLSGGIGNETATKYNSLPFLFKVLASKQPLSIQAHPNKAQAECGFVRENAEGIALNAPVRNYKDPNHKPELTLALTPFWAMCGFRPLAQIQRNFSHFGNYGLDFGDHQRFFSSLMQLGSPQKEALLEAALAAVAASGSAVVNFGPTMADAVSWVLRLAHFYPGDLGILAPFYLHLLCLEPAQAIYLPAGILHAYLEGSAMELMASSDNVLRGGLTPKHKDLPELMKTLVFEEFSPDIIVSREMDLHRSYYPTTAAEFRLERWCLRPTDSALYFPQKHPVMLAFVYSGCAEINGVTLARGQSCIIPVSCGEVSAKVCKNLQDNEEAVLYVAAAKDI